VVDFKFGNSWGGWCSTESLGGLLQVTPDLRWDMAPRLISCMICGVEKLSHIYLVLLALRMLS
jgi:hypothetical protein